MKIPCKYGKSFKTKEEILKHIKKDHDEIDYAKVGKKKIDVRADKGGKKHGNKSIKNTKKET